MKAKKMATCPLNWFRGEENFVHICRGQAGLGGNCQALIINLMINSRSDEQMVIAQGKPILVHFEVTHAAWEKLKIIND